MFLSIAIHYVHFFYCYYQGNKSWSIYHLAGLVFNLATLDAKGKSQYLLLNFRADPAA